MGLGLKDQQMRLYLVEKNSTRELKSEEISGLLPSHPLGFSKDGQSIYLEQKNEIGAPKIVNVSLQDFLQRTTLFSSKVRQSSEDIYSPSALRGPGIRSYIPEVPIQHLIGTKPKQSFNTVAKAIPGDKETVVSRSSDWSKFIVYSWNKTTYSYFLFNASNNQLMKLGGS
jgi:hypothetical protein